MTTAPHASAQKAHDELSVVMLGATGAVGGEVVKALLTFPELTRLTLLGRRPVEGLTAAFLDEHALQQHSINIFNPSSYVPHLPGHTVAICTLGVGQPSKVSRQDLVKIDKTAVLDFAAASKTAGISHFELLGSVGANANSPSFFLRNKGELEDGLKALEFDRLSIFRPSMILTPTNRYGLSQALTLKIWPLLAPVLRGGLRKYRGIPVEQLGQAIAGNIRRKRTGNEILTWDNFVSLAKAPEPATVFKAKADTQ